jgi:molybdopterin molybdotransferase
MISPSEALRIVLENAPRLEPVDVALLEAAGGVLAETAVSPTDLPPFDKSAMDGYAVRATDMARLPADLAVTEQLPAGVAPSRPLAPGTCAKIMTGAPVPPGADAVVPVEDTEPAANGRVRIVRADASRSHICPRGEDLRAGAPLVEAGRVLRPQEIGLLASAGHARVRIYRRPRVAVLATGNEVVPPDAAPGPGQIRDANSWSLLAACRQAGVPAASLGIARDDAADLRARIATGLGHDVLIISGGVSVGDWDLVPALVREAGVAVHFATVRMKPGKPTLFGTRGGCLVFGLPGNPVSTLVGFRLLVWPALRSMMGHAIPSPPPLTAVLAGPVTVRGDRVTFVPAVLRREGETWSAEALKTHGSADLAAFSRANALVVLDPGTYAAGHRAAAHVLDLAAQPL